MSEDRDLVEPASFTAGTVGEPGQRIFFLQATDGDGVFSLKVEKAQVAALAEYLGGVVEQLEGALEQPVDAPELEQPVMAAWTVGGLGVAYDAEGDRIVVMAQELTDDEEAEPSTARFHITRGQTLGFIERATSLLRAGRPLCPVCARPIDSDGHDCAGRNGDEEL